MTRRTNSFFKPVKDMTVVEQVIDRLTNAMINKEIRPGDKLPPEMELASIFGVGRNSIREAIKVLTSYGVLETRRPEGTFVTRGFSDRMINPLLYGIILNQSDSIDSLKELREMIDFGILQLAATKATDEDIKLLSERLDTLKRRLKTGKTDKIFEADDNFHEAISLAAHNPLAAQIARMVRKLTSDIRRKTLRNMVKLKKMNEMEQAHQIMFDVVKYSQIEYSKTLLTYGILKK